MVAAGIPASVFEIRIPEEREPVPDRKIYGEVAEQKKTDTELQAMKKPWELHNARVT
jgi:hypothetical protein